MCFDHDGYAEGYREEIRKARKQHKCFECFKPILPGERYQYVSGIYDHEPFSNKTCIKCVVLTRLVVSDVCLLPSRTGHVVADGRRVVQSASAVLDSVGAC